MSQLFKPHRARLNLSKKHDLCQLLSALNRLARSPALSSLLLGILVGLELEDAAVKDPANVVLAKDAILWPEKQVSCKPFEEGGAPAEEVKSHPLALVRSDEVPDVDTPFVTAIVLGEEIFKVLGPCRWVSDVM